MPCHRVLAPVIEADPPQAAETATARSLPAGVGVGEIPVVMLMGLPDMPLRTSLTEGRLSGSFSSLPNIAVHLLPDSGSYGVQII